MSNKSDSKIELL